jgi:hypothetical protein
MMSEKTESSLIARVLPDIVAFALGLGLAWFLKWETRDLVWSLWLCSLVLGYLTLLTAIGGAAWIGFAALDNEEAPPGGRLKAMLVGLPAMLFLMGFFSIHFGGFHAGHSVFLQQFFPVEGMPKDGFGQAFMNPLLLWKLTVTHLMAPYGLFLIPAILAERHHLLTPVVRMKKVVDDAGAMALISGRTGGRTGKKANPIGEAMGRPYINVVRMHLLIFFFAASYALHLDSFIIYAVVYSVYFFPWREFRRSDN